MASHFEFPKTYDQLVTLAEHTRRDALSRVIADERGNHLRVLESLGGGGQMNVFRVMYKQDEYAIGLPHDDGFHQWQDRIQTEVHTTNTVRELGIPTHPLFEPIQLRIANVPIPGILMYPFDTLECDIRQGDGYYESRFQYPLQVKTISNETLPSLFGYIANEIATIARHGFHHRFSLENLSDCINFSVFPDGSLHLFLTDLGTITFDSHIPIDGKRAIGLYMLMKTIQYVGNALPTEMFNAHRTYLKQLERDSGILLNSKAQHVKLTELFTLTDMVLDTIG